jgi:glutaredoxin 2
LEISYTKQQKDAMRKKIDDLNYYIKNEEKKPYAQQNQTAIEEWENLIKGYKKALDGSIT